MNSDIREVVCKESLYGDMSNAKIRTERYGVDDEPTPPRISVLSQPKLMRTHRDDKDEN